MPNDETKSKVSSNGIHQSDVMNRTVEILTAYLSNPSTRMSHNEIAEAYRAVRDAIKEDLVDQPIADTALEIRPAVSPKKSVFPTHIVCLECGGNFKSLKRHVKSAHGLTIEEYKEKFGLEDSYPTVAEEYSLQRSKLAKAKNLGGYLPGNRNKPSEED